MKHGCVSRGAFLGEALGLILLCSCGGKPGYLHEAPQPLPRLAEARSQSARVVDRLRGGKVDIVWVIDNSTSMRIFQERVSENIHRFIARFSGSQPIPWRMGLLSTAVNENPYLGFTPDTALSWQTPDAIEVFRRGVGRLGDQGDGREQGFDPVLRALTRYPGFLDPQAHLALIFLTDVDDQSELSSPESFLRALARRKGGEERLLAYGILGGLDIGCDYTADDRFYYQGSRY